MSYAAAVENLNSLGLELAPSAAETAAGAKPVRRKFVLAHMRALAQGLGNPQQSFPALLIAGTNGKGSTAATLASILTAAGYRTGLYTSPHLVRVNERIQMSAAPESTEVSARGGPGELRPIADEDFARLYFRVDEAGRELLEAGLLPHKPSYFEVLTALAFCYFAEQRVDIAVLEVGLGGRLDATNIVDPLLSIITAISLDHMDYLGTTIAEITREKAGILRQNATLITLPQHPEANQAIGDAAATLALRAINAADYIPPAMHGNGNAVTAAADDSLPTNRYTVMVEGQPLEVDSPLSGQHQQRNIALAIAAAVELRHRSGNDQAHIGNRDCYN